jgi:ERO1-like protein alpha
MDCVGCEKCRMWAKLEIMGIGTAIKLLLLPPEKLHSRNIKDILTRQEIIALINTMNQFAKAIHFAIHASDLELNEKIYEIEKNTLYYIALGGLVIGCLALIYWIRKRFITKKRKQV